MGNCFSDEKKGTGSSTTAAAATKPGKDVGAAVPANTTEQKVRSLLQHAVLRHPYSVAAHCDLLSVLQAAPPGKAGLKPFTVDCVLGKQTPDVKSL